MSSPKHAAPRSADGADRAGGTGPAAPLRHVPRLSRSAALGSMGAGAVLFVVASLAAPLAGARPHHPARDVDAVHARAVPAPPTASATGSAASLATLVDSQPVHVRTPAPATKAVISGLAANGIPRVALNAYRVAAARIDHADPGCGLDWALLAGIGRVESDHGQYDGAVLHGNGISTPRIIGPALDGTHTDYVPAPADGEQLDGDAVYAHALGPMQFIPQTWARYGADADGDGVANVFDINDAALGAARYLCAAGGNLRTASGQRRAVLAYNHSDEYLAEVLALADAYRRGVPVHGIPIVGNTSGTLSPVSSTDMPPANPGNPTALQGHGSHTGNKAAGKPGRTGAASTSAAPGTTSAPAGSATSTQPGAPATSGPPQPPATSSSPPSAPSPTPTRCSLPNPLDPGTCLLG